MSGKIAFDRYKAATRETEQLKKDAQKELADFKNEARSVARELVSAIACDEWLTETVGGVGLFGGDKLRSVACIGTSTHGTSYGVTHRGEAVALADTGYFWVRASDYQVEEWLYYAKQLLHALKYTD